MSNPEREMLAIYLSMLINGLYFVFMLYAVIQYQKRIYIIDITTINWCVGFFSAITGRIITTYLDKKYSDEALRNQAMEASIVLSYLYIFLVIIQRVMYVAMFFIVVMLLVKH